MTITTGPNQKPPPHPFYGDNYHRGLDPFHPDSMPDEFKEVFRDAASAERKGGWFLCDAYGNEIGFAADGSVFEV